MNSSYRRLLALICAYFAFLHKMSISFFSITFDGICPSLIKLIVIVINRGQFVSIRARFFLLITCGATAQQSWYCFQ